jgi:hypothetical protein
MFNVFGATDTFYQNKLYQVFDIRMVQGAIFFLVFTEKEWKYIGASNFVPQQGWASDWE